MELFGYGNGHYMCIADEQANDKEYYEAMVSPFEKGALERLTEVIKKRGKELCQ